MATSTPPPPQQVEEVHLTRWGIGVAKVLNDFRLLAMVLLVCILGAIVYGAIFMLSAGRGATALLYIPFFLIGCRWLQRLARRW